MNTRARQHGAAAVFVAISLTAAITALALSLDLGRLYFTHRDLQRMADMAALDASRAASGCLGEVADPLGAATAEAIASLQRNGGQNSYLTAGKVQLGSQILRDNVRTFVAGGAGPQDSVQITLRRPFPPRLVPLFGSSDALGSLSASAAATLRPVVSLDVRSSLAELDPRILNDLLSRLLGGTVGIDALSYQGLFGANVSLRQIEVAASGGGTDRFLETEVTAPEFLRLIADALDESVDVAVRNTLLALAAGADASRTVVPGEVMGVPAGENADDAFVNVGALVTSLAQEANSDRLIDLPVNVDLPPLLGPATVTVRVIERARPAVGPAILDENGDPQTFANSAQVAIQLQVPLLPVLGNPVTLNFFTEVADARAGVTGLSCAQRGRPYAQVQVNASTSIGRLGIGEYVDINVARPEVVPAPLVNLSVLGFPIRIMAVANVDLGGDDERNLEFSGPFPTPPQSIGVSVGESLAQALEDAAGSVSLSIEGLPGGALNGPVQLALQPLLDALAPQIADALRLLDQRALAPLLTGLGVQTGTAEVRVESVSGDQPILFAR
jgi:uncharacterized membrane protein